MKKRPVNTQGLNLTKFDGFVFNKRRETVHGSLRDDELIHDRHSHRKKRAGVVSNLTPVRHLHGNLILLMVMVSCGPPMRKHSREENE